MAEKVTDLAEYRERKNNRDSLARAAYWAVVIEDTYKALEVAQRNREDALREAGMLQEEKGLE